MMWEERRRFEEMEYYNWHGHGHPGMPPPRGMPFGGPGPHMVWIILVYVIVLPKCYFEIGVIFNEDLGKTGL